MSLWRRLALAVLCPVELPVANGERRRATASGARAGAGAAAEEAAAVYLALRGYRILCRNRANSLGELDIVARREGRLVFVEVRSRSASSPVAPGDVFTRGKRERLARAAELFARQHGLSRMDQRIDAVFVALAKGGAVVAVEHFPDCAGADGRL